MLKRIKPTDLLGDACSIDAYGEFLADEFLKRPTWLRKFNLSQYHDLVYPSVPLKYCWFNVTIDGGNYASNKFPVFFSGKEHTSDERTQMINQAITLFFGPSGANVCVTFYKNTIRVNTTKKWNGINAKKHTAVKSTEATATHGFSRRLIGTETGTKRRVGEPITVKRVVVETPEHTEVGAEHSGKHKTGKLADLAKQKKPPPPSPVSMESVAPTPTQVSKESVGIQHVVPEFEPFTTPPPPPLPPPHPPVTEVDLSLPPPTTGSKVPPKTKEQYYPKREKDTLVGPPPPLEDIGVGNGITTKYKVGVFAPTRLAIKYDNELGETRFKTFGKMLRNIAVWKEKDKALIWSVKTGGTKDENKKLLIFVYNEAAMAMPPASGKLSLREELQMYQKKEKTPEIMSRILREITAEIPTTGERWIERALEERGTVEIPAAHGGAEKRGVFKVAKVEGGDGKTLKVVSPIGKTAHGRTVNIFDCEMPECIGATIVELDTPFM